MATNEKILHIAGENYQGIKTLQIPTSDKMDATESNGKIVKFLDTSDGTATIADIVAGKTSYGVNEKEENSLIEGTMPPLDLKLGNYPSDYLEDVYLQQAGIQSNSSNSIATGIWTFDLDKFDAYIDTLEIDPDALTEIKEENLVFTAGGKTYTGIKLTVAVKSALVTEELLFKSTDEGWTSVAASITGSNGWQWGKAEENYNPINITAIPKEGLNDDFYTFLTTVAIGDTVIMKIKVINNVYIPVSIENDQQDYVQALRLPGFGTLVPGVVKKDVVISGLKDGSGNDFIGTLQAATVSKIDDSTLSIE